MAQIKNRLNSIEYEYRQRINIMAKKYSKHKKDKSSKNKASSEFSDKEKLKLQILSVQQLSILNIYG